MALNLVRSTSKILKVSESASPGPSTDYGDVETVFNDDVFSGGEDMSPAHDTLIANIAVKMNYCKEALAIIGEAPATLRASLLKIGRISTKDKSQIGVLGNPGAGEYSTINPLVACDDFLPSGGGSTSVTGSLISLKWNDSDEWQYVGKINYHDYKVTEEIIASALQAYDEAAQAKETVDRKLPAIVMFEAPCPNINARQTKFTAQQVIELCQWKELLDKTTIIRANSAIRFRENLHTRIVPKIKNSSGEWRRAGSTWPIIRD